VLRLGGVWFAIATLAFAFFFDSVMVKLSWIGGGDTALLEGTRVPRPTIGPWDFANDLSFLGLAVAVFALVSVAVIRIREGTVGRTLRALRGSEVAAASIGISPARARIVAFAVSAFIAGLGGAMLSMLQENVNYTNNFAPFAALFWLVLVVTLGCRTVEGAANAGAAFALFDVVILRGELIGWILRSPDRIPDIFPISPKWRFVLFGLGTIQFARHPEGLVEHGKRQWMARLQRRAGPSTGPSEGAQAAEPDTAGADVSTEVQVGGAADDAATVGAEEPR
jgi:ABC-type branched-subunit amino acid transport system permease subunit